MQLRKSANSIRSNYRAARKGRSRAEFESKLQIAFEEADECVDWLEYLRDGTTSCLWRLPASDLLPHFEL